MGVGKLCDIFRRADTARQVPRVVRLAQHFFMHVYPAGADWIHPHIGREACLQQCALHDPRIRNDAVEPPEALQRQGNGSLRRLHRGDIGGQRRETIPARPAT